MRCGKAQRGLRVRAFRALRSPRGCAGAGSGGGNGGVSVSLVEDVRRARAEEARHRRSRRSFAAVPRCPARAHGAADSEACLCILRAAARRAEVARETRGRKGERPAPRDTGHRDRPLSAGARQARPGKALVAAMPVALADARGGNQIAVLQFPLGTPGKSPAARLADILTETAKVKGVIAAGNERDRDAVHDARARAPGIAGEGRSEGRAEGEQSPCVESVRAAREALPHGRGGRTRAADFCRRGRADAERDGGDAGGSAPTRLPRHARRGTSHRKAGGLHGRPHSSN